MDPEPYDRHLGGLDFSAFREAVLLELKYVEAMSGWFTLDENGWFATHGEKVPSGSAEIIRADDSDVQALFSLPAAEPILPSTWPYIIFEPYKLARTRRKLIDRVRPRLISIKNQYDAAITRLGALLNEDKSDG
jgi:hypothetical protein